MGLNAIPVWRPNGLAISAKYGLHEDKEVRDKFPPLDEQSGSKSNTPGLTTWFKVVRGEAL